MLTVKLLSISKAVTSLFSGPRCQGTGKTDTGFHRRLLFYRNTIVLAVLVTDFFKFLTRIRDVNLWQKIHTYPC